jgi:ubiquinone/menaquinone biosynthesis C-methylase UbiE
MQATWDYTTLADSYIKRPDYATDAIDKMCEIMELSKHSHVCDIGAGAGHLTIELAKRGMKVNAVEPNDAMRAHGIARTQQFNQVNWFKGTGEETHQANHQFDAVTFGSSFNVCDHHKALQESLRICKSGGWFACMWNHRQLEDPIQQKIESIIRSHLPHYDYGSRRQDQTPILQSSNLFKSIDFVEGNVQHQQTIAECIEAWRSHGTLYRQANEDQALFHRIIQDIESYLQSLNVKEVTIPYVTRIWIAKFIRK